MSETVQDQIQWLIRKSTPMTSGSPPAESRISVFTILGPFLTDQVREMLRTGMLEADDELGPENGYWFGLQETAELRRFFGLDQAVVAKPEDEETTEPDLEVTRPDFTGGDDEKTPPSIEAVVGAPGGGAYNPDATGVLTVRRTPAPKPAAAPAATAAKSTASAPERPKPPSAQELANKFQRVAPQAPLVYTTPNPENGRSASIFGIEKGQIWAILIVAALVMAALGVIWVIRSLRG